MQIVMRQFSGFGNQLFQYAAGKYYAQQHGAQLRLVIDPPKRAVSHGHPRPFLLSELCIVAPFAETSAQDSFVLSQRRSLRSLVSLSNRLRHIQVFRESFSERHTFQPALPVKPATELLYLVGYWQTHHVVDSIADQLRTELAFRNPPRGAANRDMMAKIANCDDSVSLHVRRGDYTLAIEGNLALPLEYYTRAIAYFRERLANPTFFIFSDDIPYMRQHLSSDLQAVFVDHNDEAAASEDLRLMSACRHHIIANSSFSWWGAWLNPNRDKLVFAPRYWHLKPDSFYPDLLPPAWHTVPL